MDVEIRIKSEEQPNLVLSLESDDESQYVWISVKPIEQEATICVRIEDIKQALRKLSTK